MKETLFPVKNLTTIFNMKEKKKKKRPSKVSFALYHADLLTSLTEFLAEQHLGTNCIRTFRFQWMLQVPESEYEILFILSFIHINLAFHMKKGM